VSAPAVAARRILVVDDHADSREATATLLRVFGCDVLTAATAEDALAVVEREAQDVIVADLTLWPSMDGCELARRLRALPGGDAIFLVALTGHTEAEDVARAGAAGFDAYVTKPADPEKLRALVATKVHQRPREDLH
jgi:CheY-like chemotaxis protein